MKTWIAINTLLIVTIVWAQPKVSVDPTTSKAVYNMVGTAKLVKGDVFKLRPDKDGETRLGRGHALNEGDMIKTRSRSFVKITMIDDTTISLGPNTVFHFKEFKFKSKKDRKSVYGFLVGQMRAKIVNKAKDGDIKVATRTASMGIRGTEVLGNVNARDDGKIVTEFALIKGKVDVLNRLTGKTTKMKPKEHYIALTDGKKLAYNEGSTELTQAMYRKLLSEGATAADIKPFLNFYDGKGVGPDRTPSSVSGKPEYDDESSSESVGPDGKRKRRGKNWKNNMRELNKRLYNYNN